MILMGGYGSKKKKKKKNKLEIQVKNLVVYGFIKDVRKMQNLNQDLTYIINGNVEYH